MFHIYIYIVITGCTDGIGRAYAQELVRHGLRKFVLVGRTPEKLVAVAKLLRAETPEKLAIEQLQFDYVHDDFGRMERFLESYDVGFLRKFEIT